MKGKIKYDCNHINCMYFPNELRQEITSDISVSLNIDSHFDKIIEEMKQGNSITKPDYYKIPEGEVIDLIERLAKDSKEVLTTEQIVSLSHLLTYILRFPYKGQIEDLKKAKYYLDRLLQCKEN